MIAYNCPNCGKSFQLPDERAGLTAKCPCGHKGVVPKPAPVDWDALVKAAPDDFNVVHYVSQDEVERALAPTLKPVKQQRVRFRPSPFSYAVVGIAGISFVTATVFAFFVYALVLTRADRQGDSGVTSAIAFCVMVSPLVAVFSVVFLAVWVVKDCRSRGMDGSVLWLFLVGIVPFVGAFIYVMARTEGDLVGCLNCRSWKLEFLEECPHCKCTR